MRIIAGRLGGRIFDSPNGHRTHPMSDKMRGALFNALGDIEGLTVLDAFAGSGALAFEAISRGAQSVVAIDNDKAAAEAMAGNVTSLGLNDTVKVIRVGVNSWLETSPETQAFDIILADPPYDDLQVTTIQKLATRLVSSGLLVLSWPGRTEPPSIATLHLVQQNNYTDSQLLFYRSSDS